MVSPPDSEVVNLVAELRAAALRPEHLTSSATLLRLRQIMRRRLGHGDPMRAIMDSEDLAQSALLDLVQAIDRFRGTTWTELASFAAAIARRRLQAEARHSKAQRRNGHPEKEAGDAGTARSPLGTPSQIAASAEDRARLLANIQLLPHEEKHMLEQLLAGLSYAEIAAETGLTEVALRKRASRAMQSLAARWAH